MKKLFLSSAFTISVLALIGSNDPLRIGAAIPHQDKPLKDISGKQITFKNSMKTNGLLVMFSCNTCPVVKKYQSRTLEAAADAASKNVGVVLINSNEATRDNGDSFDDMKEYATGQGYSFNYVLDENSAMADAFGAARTPEVFLFDAKGLLVYHGAIDDNPNGPSQVTRQHLQLALAEMTAGKDVAVKTTRSVGCGIKRIE